MTRSHAAVWCVVAVLGCLTASRSLAAHHGTLVSYDRDKAWTAKAVVTEFRYVNPHAQLYFDVKDDKSHAGHWSGAAPQSGATHRQRLDAQTIDGRAESGDHDYGDGRARARRRDGRADHAHSQ